MLFPLYYLTLHYTLYYYYNYCYKFEFSILKYQIDTRYKYNYKMKHKSYGIKLHIYSNEINMIGAYYVDISILSHSIPCEAARF